ncbi:MAG: PleD family two-component system response regulator [Pseudomonadota bacterium]
MTARVLVVDDVDVNVKLLEARLMASYFQVVTATNGSAALSICQEGQCDIVLLDIMMPEMDGYEVCRRIKENPSTMHIPVIMVTALDSPEDRVKGLQAGADDFLTKPVNDLALITRVKSLVRLKMLTDDLRLRVASGDDITIEQIEDFNKVDPNQERGRVVVVDDRVKSYEKTVKSLSAHHDVDVVTNGNDALFQIAESDYEMAIISLNLHEYDSLRLCSHLRSLERTRQLPILVMADANQESVVSQALEIGVNDYVMHPVDAQELMARMRTQLRRKRFNDFLRKSVQQSIELAVRDPLTGLHNRRYMQNHFKSMFAKATKQNQLVSTILCDIDHFKSVNDNYGHDVGDEVIKEVANRIQKNIRNIDTACRFGGEEFVVIMPDTDMSFARTIAERIRQEVSEHPVYAQNGSIKLNVTISVGVACKDSSLFDSPDKLLKRSDVAMYNAKRSGRNQVMIEAA